MIASARSFLFVPANRPERFAKALASGADAIIIDLEDAVSPADKPTARGQLATGFTLLSSADRARTVVRMNAQGTPFHEDDLTLLQSLARQRELLRRAYQRTRISTPEILRSNYGASISRKALIRLYLK